MEKYQEAATLHVSVELLRTPLPEYFPVFPYIIIAQRRENVCYARPIWKHPKPTRTPNHLLRVKGLFLRGNFIYPH